MKHVGVLTAALLLTIVLIAVFVWLSGTPPAGTDSFSGFETSSVSADVTIPAHEHATAVVEDEWLAREVKPLPTPSLPPERRVPEQPRRPTIPVKRVVAVRVVAGNAFVAGVGQNQEIVYLKGVLAPKECADATRAAFEQEAQRFLQRYLEDEELLIFRDGTSRGRATYGVRRARDRDVVSLTMLRNGYGCLDEGDIPPSCPYGFTEQSRLARVHKRGMWRDGAPFATGFVTQAQNAIAVLERLRRY